MPALVWLVSDVGGDSNHLQPAMLPKLLKRQMKMILLAQLRADLNERQLRAEAVFVSYLVVGLLVAGPLGRGARSHHHPAS